MLTEEQTNNILDTLEVAGVDHIVMDSHGSKYLYNLHPCDSDHIVFHRGQSEPFYFHKLVVSDSQTTTEPVYKDWFMTVSYHS